MAKNFKLNIKNAQLAAVLEKNKLKKTPQNKEPSESIPQKEEISAEKEKPTLRITKRAADEYLKATEPEVKKEIEIVAKEEKPVVEVPTAVESPKPEIVVENKNIEEVVRKDAPETLSPIIKKSTRPLAGSKPKEEIAEEPKQEKKKTKSTKTTSSTPPYSKPGQDFKAAQDSKQKKVAQSNYKRQAFSRVFDSRTKNTGDDTWIRRRNSKNKLNRSTEDTQRPSEISVQLPISIKDLAAQMKLKATELIQKLFLQGMPITINDELDDVTTVELIGNEFDCQISIDTRREERLLVTDKSIETEIKETKTEDLRLRPPVVTVMGHVDHGKTSIIDSFRKSNLTAGEAGAITQHIGAFVCHTSHGSFSVLDTPGHEAFSAIRSRGANATDIVVLVIAGDEGMKRQTEEAIIAAQTAKVPIIVAINKCDKPGFNTENIYRQLADKNLLPEAWGGEVITVNCSAKTGEGIEQLGEMIAIQTEVLELKANPNFRARGTVLESELHRGLGPTATLLIQNGTLKLGDAILFQYDSGRIKTMHDEFGNNLEVAPPSTPVKVTGLSGVPPAGNEFIVVENEKEARKIADERRGAHKRKMLRLSRAKNMDTLFSNHKEAMEKKVLNVILKADVGGSLEAVKDAILNIPTDKVIVNFVSTDVGQISESDIELAEASKAIILGFHIKVESYAESMIKSKKIKIVQHDVIYHLIDEVTLIMKKLLDKVRTEEEVASAKVLTTFKSSHLGIIAGCIVNEGVIKRSHYAKLERKGEIIWEGNVSSLKRHNDDVKEVKKDLECGVLLQGFSKVLEGDIIHFFEITYIEQEL